MIAKTKCLKLTRFLPTKREVHALILELQQTVKLPRARRNIHCKSGKHTAREEILLVNTMPTRPPRQFLFSCRLLLLVNTKQLGIFLIFLKFWETELFSKDTILVWSIVLTILGKNKLFFPNTITYHRKLFQNSNTYNKRFHFTPVTREQGWWNQIKLEDCLGVFEWIHRRWQSDRAQ